MMTIKFVHVVLVISTFAVAAHSEVIKLNSEHNVSNAKVVRQLWTSTGFCPPAPHEIFNHYIGNDALRQNIRMIGGLPYSPQTFQIRIHWLLDLVTVDADGSFNFTYLDDFIHYITTSGLSIGFELMGNPGNVFTDFENHTQVLRWYKLVNQIGK